jgi:hypothetical protein
LTAPRCAPRPEHQPPTGVIDGIQEQVLAPLSETERRQLTKLLRKLVA